MIYSNIVSWAVCHKVVVIYPQSVPVLVVLLNNNIPWFNIKSAKI